MEALKSSFESLSNIVYSLPDFISASSPLELFLYSLGVIAFVALLVAWNPFYIGFSNKHAGPVQIPESRF